MFSNSSYDLVYRGAVAITSIGKIILTNLYHFVKRSLINVYYLVYRQVTSIPTSTGQEVLYLVSTYSAVLVILFVSISPRSTSGQFDTSRNRLSSIIGVFLAIIQGCTVFTYMYSYIVEFTIFCRVILLWWYSFLASAFVVYVVAPGFENSIGYDDIVERHGSKTMASWKELEPEPEEQMPMPQSSKKSSKRKKRSKDKATEANKTSDIGTRFASTHTTAGGAGRLDNVSSKGAKDYFEST